ncbi:hypothetical protein H6F96_14650 [Microcoleus sp. FACHB-53]|nr:hypothetical protein [Microcoleus sp. FACHB-53]
MISDPLLQALPVLLETKPELFSAADLQNLQQTLAPLENDLPENADEILREWCKARRSIRDALRNLASDRKELGKIASNQSDQDKRVTNFFQELRQQVQDTLNKKSNQGETPNK